MNIRRISKPAVKIAFVLFVMLVLTSIFFVNHWRKTASIQDIANQTPFNLQFKGFSILIPREYVLSESPDYSQEMYGLVITSNIHDESGCVKVTGLQDAILQKQTKTLPKSWMSYPVIEIQAWNQTDLQYLDVDSKKLSEARQNNLKNLAKYSPLDLDKLVYSAIGKNADTSLLNLWEGFTTCGGIYSYPSFIEKQEIPPQSEFDEVYYGEVFEGNGDTFGMPNRLVMARFHDIWIIFKEQQPFPEGFTSSCPVGNLGIEEYKCAKHESITNRNSKEYKAWVQQVLSWINI